VNWAGDITALGTGSAGVIGQARKTWGDIRALSGSHSYPSG